jgi:hypothetical protein
MPKSHPNSAEARNLQSAGSEASRYDPRVSGRDHSAPNRETDGGPLRDVCAEAGRVASAARTAGLALRVTGGVAVALRSPSAATFPLARRYADIDCVGRAKERKHVGELFAALGYQADDRFNALHGSARQYFWDPVNERQVDIFLDCVQMCHTIDLRHRLACEPDQNTLSLADLLLLKLQIIETNEKDLLDLVALLVDHDFGEGDQAVLNLTYLTELARHDWGLWRTTTMVAERTLRFAEGLAGFGGVARVHTQVTQYIAALTDVPKSRRWKLRASIGDRKRWYELPEDVR